MWFDESPATVLRVRQQMWFGVFGFELPAAGIRGNTHFPMSDLNNVAVADHLSQFLVSRRLDR